jgi:hypothetical protein
LDRIASNGVRLNPATGKRRSLRKIAAELAAMGHANPNTGEAYSATALAAVLPSKG